MVGTVLVISDFVAASSWGVVGRVFADFVAAMGGEWWVRYFQILQLPGAGE